jgi:hypothetical protein
VRGVALVEDQVDRREHRREPLRQQVVGRNAERDRGGADLLLRPDQPLRHRSLRGEERARDLLSREAAEHPQRQRDLGVDRERRMAAGERQRQSLVGNRALVHVVLLARRRHEPCRLRELLGPDALAAQPVDRTIPRRRDDPGERARRDAVPWPPLERGGERVLDGVLGEIEVPERADQDRDGAAPLLAEGGLGAQAPRSTIGRTSIVPSRADGIFAANSRASSSEAASIRK